MNNQEQTKATWNTALRQILLRHQTVEKLLALKRAVIASDKHKKTFLLFSAGVIDILGRWNEENAHQFAAEITYRTNSKKHTNHTGYTA